VVGTLASHRCCWSCRQTTSVQVPPMSIAIAIMLSFVRELVLYCYDYTRVATRRLLLTLPCSGVPGSPAAHLMVKNGPRNRARSSIATVSSYLVQVSTRSG
jgi:hypothetical protein